MIANQTVEGLNKEFGIADTVSFDIGQGGLVRIIITAQDALAHVYTHGAHLAHWQPAKHQPVLWSSAESWFQAKMPIRGGVPVCLPWFNVNPDQPEAPKHGLARVMTWQVARTQRNDDGSATVSLKLEADQDTIAVWPYRFRFQHDITIGQQLTMSLTVSNTDDKPIRITQALHTYFAVGDVRRATVTGLAKAHYIDTVGGRSRPVLPENEPISFHGETDRLYTGTPATCVLHDPVIGRRITIDEVGSNSTVVWNPWIEKAAAMEDFGDNEWPGMLCIETANIGDDAVTVLPDTCHTMTAQIHADHCS